MSHNEYSQQMAYDKSQQEEEQKCWTCGDTNVKHKTYRDALDEYELTCNKCHRIEYPEEYEEEEKVYKCSDCNLWVKSTESCCEEGITEWEVECGDMLNEDDYDIRYTERFTDKESAFSRFMTLSRENNYDTVDLMERTGVVDGCCQDSEEIMTFRKAKPSYMISQKE